MPAGQFVGAEEPVSQKVPAGHGPPVEVTVGGLETIAPPLQ